MKTIYLVTGAAGHLGSVIVDQLIARNTEVRALVVKGEKNPPANAEVYYGDVLDKESLVDFFDHKADEEIVVIHCAGIVSISSKKDKRVYEVNVNGTKNIVDLAIEYRAKKLVYVSSVHAIEELPDGQTIKEVSHFDADKVRGLYAKTKAEASAYVLKKGREGLNVSIVHPSGIIGPYDNGNSHMTSLVIDYYEGKLLAGIKGGYDFVDVRDVAKGAILSCDKGKSGECYILSNKFYRIRDILDILHELTSRKRIKFYIPLFIIKLLAPLAELYYKIRKSAPLFTSYSIYTLNSNANFSHKKADRELGYTARDIRQSLRDTISFLKLKGRLT